MNITFLIGNGFDLNLGLETSYKSFLFEYAKTTEKDIDIIKEFKKEVLTDHELWAHAERAFGESTEHNFWEGKGASDFCECHENFCIKLAEYLQAQEKKLNFPVITEDLARKFAASFVSYNLGFREEQSSIIGKTIANTTGGFTYNFIIFNYTEIIDKLFETINSKGMLGSRKIGIQEYRNQIKDIIHVHGYTNKDMVLGVNDETQIKNLDLFKNTDEEYLNQIIKVKTNEMNERNTDKKTKDILYSSDLIYIYGMSLGETDALWWQRICDVMKSKKNVRLIINDFMHAPQDELLLTKSKIYDKNKRKSFTEFCDYEETIKEEIRSRIHIDHTNLFSRIKDYVLIDLNKKKRE